MQHEKTKTLELAKSYPLRIASEFPDRRLKAVSVASFHLHLHVCISFGHFPIEFFFSFPLLPELEFGWNTDPNKRCWWLQFFHLNLFPGTSLSSVFFKDPIFISLVLTNLIDFFSGCLKKLQLLSSIKLVVVVTNLIGFYSGCLQDSIFIYFFKLFFCSECIIPAVSTRIIDWDTQIIPCSSLGNAYIHIVRRILYSQT